MSSAKKLWINGYSGRMGSLVLEKVTSSQSHKAFQLLGGSDQRQCVLFSDQNLELTQKPLEQLLCECHLVIDFSSAQGNAVLFQHCSAASLQGQAILIGSTGLSTQQKDAWSKLAKDNNLRILMAPNTSLGVILTLKASLGMAKALGGKGFDIEIVESHHRQKIDSPSGTACLLAQALADQQNLRQQNTRTGKREEDEIGVVALRGGSVFGEHTIKFLGDNEHIEITHTALNRDLFADGALNLCQWLLEQKSGCYGVTDISL